MVGAALAGKSTDPAHAAAAAAQGRARADPMAEPFGARGPTRRIC